MKTLVLFARKRAKRKFCTVFNLGLPKSLTHLLSFLQILQMEPAFLFLQMIFLNQIVYGLSLPITYDNGKIILNEENLLGQSISAQIISTDGEQAKIISDLASSSPTAPGEDIYAVDYDGSDSKTKDANNKTINVEYDSEDDPLSGICHTPECILQLKQYMEWRQENGYPVPSGSWGK